MSLLSAVGTASYNGYVFNETTETTGFECSPQLDASRRVIKNYLFRIELTFTVNVDPGSTTDATVEAIRRQLMVLAGELHYQGKGSGNFVVNLPGGQGTRDAEWGPIPVSFKWRPSGNLAAKISWAVEFRIPDCADAQYTGPMEFVYKLTFSKDKSAYTTRTYSGHLTIAQTRRSVGDRTLHDNADNYRGKVAPACPPGFRRVSEEYTPDESRCRLDFTVIDEEMPPNAPPPGVIEVKASHRLRTGRFISTARWEGTVSATYELQRDMARASAFTYFVNLLEKRVRIGLANSVTQVSPGKFERGVVVIRGLSLGEPEINGRVGAEFSATYLMTTDINTILQASGLWTPPPDSNWQQWHDSLKDSVFNPRGNAQLKVRNQDDVWVDLCGVNQVKPIAHPSGGVVTGQTGSGTRPGGIAPTGPRARPGGGWINPLPPVWESWINYVCWVRIEVEDGAIISDPLPKQKVTPETVGQDSAVPKSPATNDFLSGLIFDQAGNVIGGSAGAPGVAGPLSNPKGPGAAAGYVSPYDPQKVEAASKPIVQHRMLPQYWLILWGHGMRAGYPIPEPRLDSVGGAKAIRQNREGREFYEHAVIGVWGGLPICASAWRSRYRLLSPPKGPLPFAINPQLGV